MIKSDPNEGLSKVYWIIFATAAVLVILGAILWWYDGYLIEELSRHRR